MLDGRPLIDVHQHVVRRTTVKRAWNDWADEFGDPAVIGAVWPDGDAPSPAAYLEHLAGEGVDVAFAFAEYSPKVTGYQLVEDIVPLVEAGDGRVRLMGNLNPHLHFPAAEEVERQLALGAVGIKLHPVHGGFAVDDRALYPAYDLLQERGVPVTVHCGTSSFPGSSLKYADPVLLDDVLRDFPRLDVLLAHGGRGWWYDAAAFMALANPHVWIELSGLPPSRLREYYARHHWGRLTRRMVFGTDWPGVPGIARNARAVAALCPDDDVAGLVLAGNAMALYGLDA